MGLMEGLRKQQERGQVLLNIYKVLSEVQQDQGKSSKGTGWSLFKISTVEQHAWLGHKHPLAGQLLWLVS